MWTTLFSFQGRIGRQTWWLSQWGAAVVLVVLLAIVAGIAGLIDGPRSKGSPPAPGGIAFLVVLGPAFIAWIWLSLALGAKRWHDLGYSGWMNLVSIVPLVNIWGFVMTGFVRGEASTNSYGPPAVPDPRGDALVLKAERDALQKVLDRQQAG